MEQFNCLRMGARVVRFVEDPFVWSSCCCSLEPKPNDIEEAGPGLVDFWGKTLTELREFFEVRKMEYVSGFVRNFFAFLSVFDCRSQNSLRKSTHSKHDDHSEGKVDRNELTVHRDESLLIGKKQKVITYIDWFVC